MIGWLERFRSWWGGADTASGQRGRLGRRGEQAAARHLKRAGYRILARNLRGRFGEIDLIVTPAHPRQGDRGVVIVEVKTTVSHDPPPEAHVDPRKRRKLSALAAQLVRKHRLDDQPVRFDVVAIVWPDGSRKPDRITHHVNAFESSV